MTPFRELPFLALAGIPYEYNQHHTTLGGLSSVCAKIEPASSKNNENIQDKCHAEIPRYWQFSKSVLDIRTRPVVTVKPETKWMPNSDSALKLVPKCKILCQYDLLNYFYSCLKIAIF